MIHGSSAPDTVSVIIPTFNEADCIGELLAYLGVVCGPDAGAEIIVVDGHSIDNTAAQLNYGAAAAGGQILYFLHADTYPPSSFLSNIRRALGPAGYSSGCYRLAFNHSHWFLRLSGWFTRFNIDAVRVGNQSLFVRRTVFEQAGGYRASMIMLEDQEIVRRLRRYGSFRVLPCTVTASARKYLQNGVFRLQAVFSLLTLLCWLGLPQHQLLHVYRSLIRQDKL